MKDDKCCIALLALTIIALAACAPADSAPGLDALATQFPRLDGSTTTLVITRSIAAAVRGVKLEWTEPAPDALQRTMVPVAGSGQADSAFITGLKHNTTHQAYLNIIDGSIDCALIARLPSPDELAAAAAGVTLDTVPIALDAFVFMAHVANPLAGLSLDQIRSVYSGQTTRWDQLGVAVPGFDQPQLITAYQRERNSGSQELMEALILPHDQMIDSPQLVVPTMLGPFNAIGGDLWGEDGNRLGLGYTVYFYITSIFPHQRVKMVAVEGVQPDAASIASRRYPLTAEVYGVIRADQPEDHVGRLTRDWLLTEAGQALVADCGYVPVNPPAGQ